MAPKRQITIWWVQADIMLREVHTLTVGRRQDGTEYITRRTPGGKWRRFTLDTQTELFLTPAGGPQHRLTLLKEKGKAQSHGV